jgi:hypothetical protein
MPVLLHGGPRLGLGLWDSVAATVVVESALFALGVGVYARATRARDATGRRAFRALVVFLAVVYAGNVFGPPPPGPDAVAFGALAMWLLVAWGYWIDRHREPRSQMSGTPPVTASRAPET